MTKHIWTFTYSYAIGLGGVNLILFYFDKDGGIGTSIAVLITAALLSLHQFVNHHGRMPTKNEKNLLAWMSLISAWITSIVLALIIVYIFDIFNELNALMAFIGQNIPIFIGAIIFVSLLYLAVLYSCYGGLGKRIFNASINQKTADTPM